MKTISALKAKEQFLSATYKYSILKVCPLEVLNQFLTMKVGKKKKN